ncbi:MAG: EamA family transporter [Thermoleophilia bacterium]
MEKRLGTSLLVWVALWTVYIVWGSTYIGIRVMDETIPPMIGASTRFLAVGVLLGTFLLVRRGGSALRVTKRELLSLGIVGTLLLAAGNGVLIYAETWVPAGISAVVVASVPLWIVALRLAVRDRPKVATVAATLFGFAGVALLVFAHNGTGGATAGGLLLVVVASVSWALGSFLSARLPMPKDALVSTAWEAFLAGLVLSVAAVPELGSFHPGSVSLRSGAGLAYLISFGSILGLTAYVWLLQNAPISKVSTYAYVNPVVAIFLGVVLLGESLTPAILLGGAIIVVAVAAVIMIEGRSPRVRRTQPVPPRSRVQPPAEVSAGRS